MEEKGGGRKKEQEKRKRKKKKIQRKEKIKERSVVFFICFGIDSIACWWRGPTRPACTEWVSRSFSSSAFEREEQKTLAVVVVVVVAAAAAQARAPVLAALRRFPAAAALPPRDGRDVSFLRTRTTPSPVVQQIARHQPKPLTSQHIQTFVFCKKKIPLTPIRIMMDVLDKEHVAQKNPTGAVTTNPT
jgi:hypothetical protein